MEWVEGAGGKPLAEPIKSNWPNVTLWSVFEYPVTYDISAPGF